MEYNTEQVKTSPDEADLYQNYFNRSQKSTEQHLKQLLIPLLRSRRWKEISCSFLPTDVLLLFLFIKPVGQNPHTRPHGWAYFRALSFLKTFQCQIKQFNPFHSLFFISRTPRLTKHFKLQSQKEQGYSLLIISALHLCLFKHSSKWNIPYSQT